MEDRKTEAKVWANSRAFTGEGVQNVTARLDPWTTDRDEALALIAEFPKSVRVHVLRTWRDGEVLFGASFEADLTASRTNDGWNEAGVRRYQSFRKVLDRLGIQVTWGAGFANSLTEAEFDQRVANREAATR